MTDHLNEDNYNKLFRNTVDNFESPRDRNSKRVQTTTTSFVPSEEGLLVKAKSRTDGKSYDTVIYLSGIEMANEETPNAISIKSVDGSDFNIIPFKLMNTQLEVNCGCLDFYYRFAVWNDKHKSLYGDPPPPYRKKTNRKPVNPKQIAGLCKHIIALFDEIKIDGIIK